MSFPGILGNVKLTVECNEVGISFVSIFILTFHVFFWVCGLAHSLSWDYAPGVPQGEEANIRVSWREKPIGGLIWRHMSKKVDRQDKGRNPESADSQSQPQLELGIRHSSQGSSDQSNDTHESQASLPPLAPTRPKVPSPAGRVLAAIAVVVTPISVIVAISLFIALLDPLKALFVNFEGGPSWEGPDGEPPLAFVIDTGSFVSSPSSTEFSDSTFDLVKPSL